MARNTTRRGFIGASAALGTAFWVAPQTFARPTRSALEALTAACVGVGGKGDSDSSHIADQDVEIVGICDVDRRTLDKKSKQFKKAEQFTDFRAMLDKLGDKVDIVTVSTPDHTHAAAAIKAMKMKKHVYVQKPLTWSIREARMMREVAAEMGVVTQMGNQGTSENGLREAVEVVRSGALGDVTEVHVWTNRPVWPQGIGRPKGEDKVPDTLDWESWLGPAPLRPYKEGVYHSFNWRGWVDFGTGALGDMACHTCNLPVMGLNLWDPVAVTAVKNPGIVEGETFPGATTLMFEFPERDGLKACKFYWYDGGNLPADELIAKLPEGFRKRVAAQKAGGGRTSAALLVGSKGMLLSENDYGAAYTLLPEENYKDFKKPEPTIPRIPFKGGGDERQKWEFVESVRGTYKPGTLGNFGYAGRLTETILVGNLAVRAGEGTRIEWDAKNLVSTNRPELDKYVHREYRSGYSL